MCMFAVGILGGTIQDKELRRGMGMGCASMYMYLGSLFFSSFPALSVITFMWYVCMYEGMNGGRYVSGR